MLEDRAISDYRRRKDVVINRKNQGKDGKIKEKRCFGLSMSWLYCSLVNLFDGRPFTQDPFFRCGVGEEGYYRAVWNSLLEPIYRHTDPRGTELGMISITTSSKTKSVRNPDVMVSTEVESACQGLSAREVTPFLTSLLLSFEFSSASHVIQNPCCNSGFFLELRTIVSDCQYETNPEILRTKLVQLRQRYPLMDSLELNNKYYANTADNRAFVVDGLAERQIVGAILNVVFSPQDNNAVRGGMGSVLYTKNRNIIKQVLSVEEAKFMTFTVTDVVSFTGNYIGTWVGLLAILLALDEPSLVHVTKPIIVLVHGRPFETNIKELIQIYIYLTVGTECNDPDDGYFTSLGGLLGIQGNAPISLHMYAVELQILRSAFSPCVYNRIQVGGDDSCCIILHNSYEEGLNISSQFIEYVHNNVGYIREEGTTILKISDLSEHEDTLIGEFCKKSVYACLREGKVVIQSLKGFPMYEQLLTPPSGPKDSLQKITEILISLEDLVKQRTIEQYQAEYFLAACERFLNVSAPQQLEEKLYLQIPLIVDGSFSFSERAYQILQEDISYCTSTGILFLRSLPQKIDHLCNVRKKLVRTTVVLYDRPQHFICLRGEVGQYIATFPRQVRVVANESDYRCNEIFSILMN
jgi:hypothetical protein